MLVKLWGEPCQQKRSPVVPDHGCCRHNEVISSSEERQPDLVKFGTNATEKVAKYSGECLRNDYIFVIAILTQEK